MKRFEKIDWYDTPRYYDMIFAPGTRQEASFLEAVHEQYGSTRGKRLLEPACGSGRLLVEMARRGWSVSGFDASQPMLDYAERRLARSKGRATLAKARLESFTYARPFDLVHCLVSTFKYVPSEAGALSHLQCVAASLKSGGIYALGFHLSDYESQRTENERWHEERGKTRVVCHTCTSPPDRKRRRERVRARLTITDRGQQLRSETEWWFRTYDARQVQRLLAKVPELELLAVHDFHYELDWSVELEEARNDCVLILRKR